ncbi:MAG TPA: hypothetical protein VNZ58_06510 [Thermomicrobiales bacterium]|nr:hypothetical protein [Thermomicrobiales bacterium]
MATFNIGDEVQVTMPHAPNKRGVSGVHPMYTTSPEAKFDGATGTITDINVDGSHGIALFLVDFRDHNNRGIPWGVQWFRQNWLRPANTSADAHVNAIA